jgi:hypothetical protein
VVSLTKSAVLELLLIVEKRKCRPGSAVGPTHYYVCTPPCVSRAEAERDAEIVAQALVAAKERGVGDGGFVVKATLSPDLAALAQVTAERDAWKALAEARGAFIGALSSAEEAVARQRIEEAVADLRSLGASL